MAFWSKADIEPIRKRNFLIRIYNSAQFYAVKSVTRPVIETDANEYKILNHTFKIPSIPKYSDVTVKFVEEAGLRALARSLGVFYNREMPTDANPNAVGLNKGDSTDVVIESYDSEGKRYDSWTLKGAFVRSINSGDMDYSSDDFIEPELVLSYDYAVYEAGPGSTGASTAPTTTNAPVVTDSGGPSNLPEQSTTGGNNNLPGQVNDQPVLDSVEAAQSILPSLLDVW